MIINENEVFILGIFATFFTLWSSVPQIRKAIHTKKTDDVSKWLIVSLITGLSLWAIYGIFRHDVVIAGANIVGVALNSILLGLKFKYTKKSERDGN
jgi:MtN3 and saliva related transmembrane protein